MKAIEKDFYREIKTSFSRFISILLIVALGVAFYSGIRSIEPDMRKTGDNLYDDSNLLDLKIISTMGLSEADVGAVEGLDCIEDAVGSHSADVIAQTNSNKNVVKFMSYIDGINDVEIVEGNKPQANNECILDVTFFKNEKLNIGDTIKATSVGINDVAEVLNETTYTIAGTFTTTQYMSSSAKGTSNVGDGSIEGLAIVNEDVFVSDVYTEMYALVKSAKHEICYSDDYKEIVDSAILEIESTVEDVRIQAKYDELYDAATDVIVGIERSIEQLETSIKKSNKSIKNNNRKIKALNKEITGLDEQIAVIDKSISNYDVFIERYSDLGYVPEGKLNTYDVTIEQLEREKQEFVDKKEPIEQEKKEYENSIQECEAVIVTENESIKQSKDTIKEQQLNLADANEVREELESPRWYLTDRSAIKTYVEYDNDAERISKIGIVFPVIFFLVATFVSLTTMTRMISEQRTLIGTYKGLGYSKFSIVFKYIKYAMFATISGSIIGVIIGSKVFPVIILSAYRTIYPSLSNMVTPISWEQALMATEIAVLCVLISTAFASYKELVATPSMLMRPETPKVGKRILLERIPFIWKPLSFNAKSTIRNLLRYKKRFYMTLFGVSGCMALIIVGFGLKDSTETIPKVQYDELHSYDALVTYNMSTNAKRVAQADEFIESDSRIQDYIRIGESLTEIEKDGNTVTANVIVPKDGHEFSEYIRLEDEVTHELVDFSPNEVILTEKAAKLLGVAVGDTIQINIATEVEPTVKISKIVRNSLNHYIYMTEELYNSVYGRKVEYNQMLLHTASDIDTAELTEELLGFKAVNSVSFISTIRSSLEDVLKSIDIITAVLIISAGVLALIVLYNLNNINISERKRELATLKVLGFYDNEVTGYVYRENVIITLLGLVIGSILGAVLHKFVIHTAELDMIVFGTEIRLISYVYSALITIGFSIIINLTMYYKLKKIDMASSMKTVE